MDETEIFDPPVLDFSPRPRVPLPPDEKWERERLAFKRLLPELLQTHCGHFVAIHEGQVVVCGASAVEVGVEAYRRYGYVSIYVGLVSDRPRIVRVPSIRVVREPGTP